MLKKCKKVLAFMLTAALLVSSLPLWSAFAANETEYPIVYIEGQGIGIVSNEGTSEQKALYPLNTDILALLTENIKPLLEEIAVDAAMGKDYSGFSKQLYDLMAPIYEGLPLDGDGNPTGNSTIYKHNMWRGARSLGNIKSSIPMTNGSYPVYRWHYDWRLSPITLADELDDLIDAVLAETGAAKVNIISRCLGSNIAYAYLCSEKYNAADKVNACVMYAAATEGLGILDAIFTGEVVFDAGAVNRFVKYYKENKDLIINDEPTTELIFSLIELFEEVNVLGMSLDFVADIVNDIFAQAGPDILKASYGGFLGYWAMISPECHEKAKNFIFATDEDKEEWAGFIALADEYNELATDMEAKLKKAGESIDIAVISKYGLPDFPFSADAGLDSDGFIGADRTSFGATVTDLDKKFSSAYMKAAKENGTDKYIGADEKIDASTALFPDTTWFIKGLPHRDFPECVNDLMVKFVNNSDTVNVWSDESFTQYLQFTPTNNSTSDSTRGTLTPILTAADTNDTTEDYTKSPLQALFRFLEKLVNFFKKLFEGNKAA